jgi:hypothetical protein
MNNLEVYNQFKKLFTDLEKCINLEALVQFVDSLNLSEQIKAFYEKYPTFDFRLNADDIKTLRDSGVITESNCLNPDKFPQDTLAKLLGAVLWKNGDIKKVQHLIDGITSASEDRTEYSLIFKQYGASLASDNEPIIDQHVLRAWEIYRLDSYSEDAMEKSRRKSIFKVADRHLLDQYRTWFNQLLSKVPSSERGNYRDTIDKVIFIHGKAAKN